MKPIVLVGGGGHCKSVLDAIESVNRSIYGVLDPNEVKGTTILGYDILGGDELICSLVDDVEFIVTVGGIKDFSLRQKLHDQIIECGGQLATVIASTAYVSRHADVGEGTVILHQAVVNANAKVGKGCIVNTFSNIEHDAVVGEHSHISTGAMVNGNCVVGSHVFLGSQSVMLNGISIINRVVIAAGSFVRKSINVSGIYAGNPAMLMKKL